MSTVDRRRPGGEDTFRVSELLDDSAHGLDDGQSDGGQGATHTSRGLTLEAGVHGRGGLQRDGCGARRAGRRLRAGVKGSLAVGRHGVQERRRS